MKIPIDLLGILVCSLRWTIIVPYLLFSFRDALSEAVAASAFKRGEEFGTPVYYDSSDAEKMLDRKFIDFETVVVDTKL